MSESIDVGVVAKQCKTRKYEETQVQVIQQPGINPGKTNTNKLTETPADAGKREGERGACRGGGGAGDAGRGRMRWGLISRRVRVECGGIS